MRGISWMPARCVKANNVDLPRATNQPEDVKPETVRLSVSSEGKYYWNESEVTEEELFPRLQAEAAKERFCRDKGVTGKNAPLPAS